ncbi:RNA ligase [Arthrobacter phage Auxilium]|uniref:RNA ligase n=1 Tax=Arthrobacter phage Auxilium TaxID=2419948 RepID=A0A3G2KA27_9CAUD|nr:RNA ligase [Arthrobacter phage Auxilium]AYN55842.1 RNA ligase [Arthrobacter phage Auxilium]
MSIEFKEWPKTPRLLRNITITEKIDGTNAAVGIIPSEDENDPNIFAHVETEDGIFGVYAQSRTRLITPGKSTDNYGFAGWVERNAHQLVTLLGEGLHYGEWWGNGIQRKYGQTEKRFSLFNTDRYSDLAEKTDLPIAPVPVLYQGPNDTAAINEALSSLRIYGSVAAPGFMNPEGICVFQHASRQISKVTLDKNDAGKWEAA